MTLQAAKEKRQKMAKTLIGKVDADAATSPDYIYDLALAYSQLKSDANREAFIEAWVAGRDHAAQFDDHILHAGRTRIATERRRLVGRLLAANACSLCGESKNAVDQAHVGRNGGATDSSGTTRGVGAVVAKKLVEALKEGRVAILCLMCHRAKSVCRRL
jgi:hypothetical protein